jgi:signal transduction histidine kinase
LIPIYRNNKLEDVYWTFGYSKVIDESGNPAGVLVICNETTEKVNSYNQLESARNELAFIIEAAELATWDLDPETYRYVGNNRMKSWFGMSPDEEIDLERALQVIKKGDRQRVTEAIQKALSQGSDGNYNLIYSIINPLNNIERIVKAKGKAIFDAGGKPKRFSGILQDVTEEFQVQQRKDEFISIASHELKTPLTSLYASLQLMERFINAGTKPDILYSLVNKATKNLNKLLHLMDDLMNVTKIQQGQLALNKVWFNPAELINNCCEHIRLEGFYELVLSGDKNLMVFADSRQIEQVIANLVNNAVKYAPQSRRIELTIEKRQNEVEISVRDFGIGIDPEKIPHLFDRYYRVDSSGLQSSGFGLGLYICSEIISRHGGKIGVESELNKGSKFWFTIPVE